MEAIRPGSRALPASFGGLSLKAFEARFLNTFNVPSNGRRRPFTASPNAGRMSNPGARLDCLDRPRSPDRSDNPPARRQRPLIGPGR